MYRTYQDKQLGKEFEARTKLIDRLKNIILYRAHEAFKDENLESIELTIPRSFEEVLDDTLKSIDFMAYEITVFNTNEDLLEAIPSMPILMSMRKRS